MKSRIVVAALLLVAGAAGLTAQQPTFRAGVEIVELQAVVTDQQGNPVTGLTQDDFEVVEGGKPQQIAAFSTVDIPIEQGDRPLYSPTAIEPDVLGNDGPDGRVYLIAFDAMSPTLALRTRHFLRRFIERHFGTNDVAAIGYFDTGAKESQEFTSNKRVLLAAIDRFTGDFSGVSLPGPATNTTQDAAAAAPESVVPPSSAPSTEEIEARFRLRGRMRAFRQMVEFLAAVPGRRKALLYITPGMGGDLSSVIDYNGGTMSIEVEDAHLAMRAAATGNIAIYPIDPRGLGADGGAEFTSFEETQAAAIPAAQRLAELSNARMLAEATGGFAFTNQNTFDAAFARLVRENSSYYVIGYYSTNDRRDGRFRRVNLRVKRPGLQVRARNGYLAPRGRPSEIAPPARTTALSAATATAFANAIPSRGLPMKLSAAAFKSGGKEANVALTMSVDPDALGLVEKNGTFNGRIEVATAATVGGKSSVTGGEYTAMNLALRKDTMDRARTAGGLHVLGEIKLAPGRYQLRAALGNGADKAGSVIYDIEVPDFSKDGLVMSGVALTSQLEPPAAIAPKNPLKDFLPAPPTTVRTFSADDTVVLFAEVYDNIRTAAAHTVEIKAVLRADDGREIRTISEERSSSELTGAAGGFGFHAEVPLEGAAPGLYVIHIEARANTGNRPVVSRDVPIRVR